MVKGGVSRVQDGKVAPLDIQIAFNILALLMAIQLYDNFLKDTIGGGKTIDQLVGLEK